MVLNKMTVLTGKVASATSSEVKDFFVKIWVAEYSNMWVVNMTDE